MAYTFTQFKNGLRALFGAAQTNVSGDGGGDVVDHVDRLCERQVGPFEVAAAAASGTSTYAMLAAVVVENECDLKSVRIVVDAALTLTATDYIILNLIKKKSATWSATENIGTLNLGQTSAWSPNIAGRSKTFTLATTTSVLDLDPGDTISINGTLAATNLLGAPASRFFFNFEEK